jgi:hypothetical protein
LTSWLRLPQIEDQNRRLIVMLAGTFVSLTVPYRVLIGPAKQAISASSPTKVKLFSSCGQWAIDDNFVVL